MLQWLLFLMASAALLTTSSARNVSVPARQLDADGFRTAECMLDASMAVTHVAQAGILIADAVRDCPDRDVSKHMKQICIGEVTGIISAIASTVAFISGVVAQCPDVFGTDGDTAVCVAYSARVVAGTMSLISSSYGIAELCPEAVSTENHPNTDIDTASCVFDVGQAAFFLASAGIDIWRATEHCTGDQKLACTADISEVVRAVSAAGSFLASAGSDCGVVDNLKALCAKNIMSLISSMADIATAGVGIKEYCIPEEEDCDAFEDQDSCPSDRCLWSKPHANSFGKCQEKVDRRLQTRTLAASPALVV